MDKSGFVEYKRKTEIFNKKVIKAMIKKVVNQIYI